jgi:hypothetical protein
MQEGQLYEVWLPNQESPSHILSDGDKAARIARDEGGVFVKQGVSEEDRKALFDIKFPAALPETRIPAGLEIAIGQARTEAARRALEDHLSDKAYGEASESVPKQLEEAFATQGDALSELERRQTAHEEGVRISMEEPERYAGGEGSALPEGTEIVGGQVVSPGSATEPVDISDQERESGRAAVTSDEDTSVRAKAAGDTKETPAKAEREKADKAK